MNNPSKVSVAVGVEAHRRARILVAYQGGNLRNFLEGLINREYETYLNSKNDSIQNSKLREIKDNGQKQKSKV
jgi:hypothetical protein